MKEKIHYAIEAVLAVAVIILFALQFSGDKKTSKPTMVISDEGGTSGFMLIAYIDLDSLMSTYTYSIDLNEQLVKKYENSNASLTERYRKLQTEVNDYQRKLETGSFLSRERAEAEQQRLTRKHEELEQLKVQYSQEIEEERFRSNGVLRTTIQELLQEYNKDRGYHIIYGRLNDNIMYADDAYNITAEVIEFFNRRYASSPVIKSDD